MKPASSPSETPPVSEIEDAALHRFLAASGRIGFRLERITDEGSSRRYFRVIDRTAASAILCIDQPFREAESDFLNLSRYFKKIGLNVPEVRAFDERGWFLVEDAGATSLDQLLRSNRTAGMRAYEAALDEIVRWQMSPAPTVVAARSFDFEKLWFEMDFLFTRLRNVRASSGINLMPDADVQMFLREVCTVLSQAGPRVLTHRDFHARNIMLPDAQNPDRVVFIDFQDARMGLPWYDVTSLLFDPYASLSSADRTLLLQHYLDHAGMQLGIRRLSSHYYLQALQRIFKAIGSYLYFTFERDKPAYIESLGPALARLDEIILLGHLPDGLYSYVQRFRREFLPTLQQLSRNHPGTGLKQDGHPR